MGACTVFYIVVREVIKNMKINYIGILENAFHTERTSQRKTARGESTLVMCEQQRDHYYTPVHVCIPDHSEPSDPLSKLNSIPNSAEQNDRGEILTQLVSDAIFLERATQS